MTLQTRPRSHNQYQFTLQSNHNGNLADVLPADVDDIEFILKAAKEPNAATVHSEKMSDNTGNIAHVGNLVTVQLTEDTVRKMRPGSTYYAQLLVTSTEDSYDYETEIKEIEVKNTLYS
jgi:hypothetical protein